MYISGPSGSDVVIFQGGCLCFRRNFCIPSGVRGHSRARMVLQISGRIPDSCSGCLDTNRFESVALNLRSPPTGNDCAKSVALRATIFLTGAPVLSLGTTKLTVQRVPRGLYPGIRRPSRVAKHTVSCTAKVNAWRYSATLHTPSWPCT